MRAETEAAMTWHRPDCPRRKALRVAAGAVDADLAGFPLLVVRSDDSDLFTARRDGQDIVFTDEAGHRLPHELIDYFCGVERDAGWVWFTRPSAVRHSGRRDRTYLSYQQNSGAITIIQYDHRVNAWSAPFDLHEPGDVANRMVNEDHGPASILVRASDGRLMTWYAGHSGPDLFQRTADDAEDATAWEPEINLGPRLGLTGYAYPSPVQFSDGTIWIVFRTFPGVLPTKWYYAASSDEGATWSAPVEFFRTDAYGYVQVAQHGDMLHFCANPDHPRFNAANPTWSFRYARAADAWSAHDGTPLALPISSSTVPSVVYDGTDGRSWIWDLAVAGDGTPCILYVRIDRDDTRHRMFRAHWTGAAWRSHLVADTGTHIGSLDPDDVNYQDPWYSGGGCFDPDDPDQVYLSIADPSVHEIEHCVTVDHGRSWQRTPITRGSRRRNFRPIVPRNSHAHARLFWRQGAMADYTRHLTGITSAPPLPRVNHLAARVRVDLRAACANTIYLYWGGPGEGAQDDRGAVWASADRLVWHGREPYDVDTTRIEDSTRGANHGAKRAVNRPYETLGHAYRAQRFDGRSAVDFGALDLRDLSALTVLAAVRYHARAASRPSRVPRERARALRRVAAWLERRVRAVRRFMGLKAEPGAAPDHDRQTLLSNWLGERAGFALCIDAATSPHRLETRVRTETRATGGSSVGVAAGTWMMVGMTYEPERGLIAWKDGIGHPAGAPAGALHAAASSRLYAGAERGACAYLDGDMEAVMVSFECKSDAYVKAWTATWRNPASFCTTGSMETRDRLSASAHDTHTGAPGRSEVAARACRTVPPPND